ncbi:MAG: AAA family ATPase [Methylophilaceae bacterium]|nr:AAA family ATPase [Methylophilaceae bacterium]
MLEHISIRVPWHDNAWQGTICNKPVDNSACLALSRIAEIKREDREMQCAGQRIDELSETDRPACMTERATFMAPFSIPRIVSHPYRGWSSAHQHILPTPLHMPAFSAATVPYRWMLSKFAWEIAAQRRLDVSKDYELTNTGGWVQAGRNQKALLEGFFASIKEETSLCFFYAKQTPFSDDTRPVIVGVGRVKKVHAPVEYNYKNKNHNMLDAYLWEIVVEHSIRPDCKDGFLLPYQELAELEASGVEVDWQKCLAFCPADRSAEFSYATEHVTHDAAITAMLECKSALEASRPLLSKNETIVRALKWIDARLADLWKLRGPYPGLGPALSAFGVEHGNFLAFHLAEQLEENADPWPLVDKVLRDPTSLPPELKRLVSSNLSNLWIKMSHERRSLLKLLARFALTNQQATRYFVQEVRAQSGVNYTDAQIIENPYLIYEADRFANSGSDSEWLEKTSLITIDKGVFPYEIVATKHPLPAPSALGGPIDARRIRALTIEQLEVGAALGHTLLPRDFIVTSIREAKLQPECPVYGDVFDAMNEEMAPEVEAVSLKDGPPAYQLKRYVEIRNSVAKDIAVRASSPKRHDIKTDWMTELDALLNGKADPEDKDELKARQEKAAALAELAASRFSVFVGPAGSGKTTVLQLLCNNKEIKRDGILLLAPTGKARVQMWQRCGHEAQTLAQFLGKWGGRYDAKTGAYRMAQGEKFKSAKTVIVDESSMLTEDMLGALIDSLQGVERLILVGDPRQLPPIGAGRPFVDIVRFLTPDNLDGVFPRVGKGYAELTIQRRHKKAGKTASFPVDLQLANWFSGRALPPGEDEIWSQLASHQDIDGRIRTVRWDTNEQLREHLLDVICEELKLAGRDDRNGFEQSYGGKLNGNDIEFHRGCAVGSDGSPGIEAWQILTPFRNQIIGSININRLIHQTFRQKAIGWAHQSNSSIPKPMGTEQIVYGDKVIQIRNKTRLAYPASEVNYVANGEIGVVIGSSKPYYTNVEFSSQPKVSYGYQEKDFDDDGGAILELAYAVTIHKAQGSEFGMTILVLPEKHLLLTRELLYTALTRQQQRVIILHQGDINSLRAFASDERAETPGRFTNLFEKQKPEFKPSPIKLADNRYLEEGLIHRSRRGTALRSKSEVIIDDALFSKGIEAVYEQPFHGKDGSMKLPDFTIEDVSSGQKFIWEHCGMMANEGYRQRWEAKKAWYRINGVLPHEEGGGEVATLIVTFDDENGGIDGLQIDALIDTVIAGG